MSNDISFSGSFIINYKKAIPNLREHFERKAFEYGNRQVFENFKGDKDKVLYVFRNGRDYDVAQFIKRNHMNFVYMPDINTKLRLDPAKPQEAIQKLKELKPKKIKKIPELMEYVEANRLFVKSKHCPNIGRISRTLQILRITPEVEPIFENKTGITRYIDKAKNGEIVISPRGEYGRTYIYYKPSNAYEPVSFYEVDRQCEIYRRLSTPDEILEFRTKFNKSVNMYKSNLSSQNQS